MLETDEIKEILDTSDRLVAAVSMDYCRPLMAEIDWRGRLICIKGARGTGKTTLMRQRIKEAFGVGGKAVYISLDDLWFATHRVRDAIDYFVAHGFTHVFIDEVHHLGKDWSLLIKNVFDQFPSLSIVYSGSSLLQIETARAKDSARSAICRRALSSTTKRNLGWGRRFRFGCLGSCIEASHLSNLKWYGVRSKRG